MSDVGRWSGGGTPSKAKAHFWVGGEIPWVSPKDMKSDLITDTQDHITEDAVAQSATNLVDAGSVIIVVRSGILRHTLPVAVAQRQVALNQDLKGVKPRENIRSDYLALAIKAFERDILHECTKTGTTVQSLELPLFLRFQIPVAPLDEQRRIVAEVEKQFTRLVVGVAALRRVQANLRRYRAAVLKAAWEGRLVPTEVELADSENRKSAFETGEALLVRILTERRMNWKGHGRYKEPATPETKDLPPLPKGWTWASPAQLSAADAYSLAIGPFGSNLKVSDYTGSGIPLVFVRNIRSSRFGGDRTVFVSTTKGEELHAHRISGGDLLITKMGEPPGDACLYPESEPDAVVTADCIKLRLSNLLPDKRLFVHAINSEVVKPQIQQITKGVAQMKVSLGRFRTLALPVPPLAEQSRISAELERRLSVVFELEEVVSASLQRAARLRHSILERAFAGQLVAQEYTVQKAILIEPSKTKRHRPNVHFARALLSAEIVHRLHNEPTFGRIKHQKIFHLCEHIAQIEDIQGQYHREAAGPLDNKLIYASEAELKKQRWYQEVPRKSYGHAYKPLAQAGGHRKYLRGYWSDKLPVIEQLIERMRTWNTDQCEIVCTIYAAWNDLIIWGRQPTDVAILDEILECWHPSKKRFSRDRLGKAIAWMKTEGFVPTGFGKSTIGLTQHGQD